MHIKSDGVDVSANIREIPVAETIEIGDRLLVASRIRFLNNESDLAKRLKIVAREQRFLFAEDDTPICRIFAFRSPFVMHNCQTEEGSSGTPIFWLLADGNGTERLELVGIHSGYSARVEHLNISDPEYVRNFGVELL